MSVTGSQKQAAARTRRSTADATPNPTLIHVSDTDNNNHNQGNRAQSQGIRTTLSTGHLATPSPHRLGRPSDSSTEASHNTTNALSSAHNLSIGSFNWLQHRDSHSTAPSINVDSNHGTSNNRREEESRLPAIPGPGPPVPTPAPRPVGLPKSISQLLDIGGSDLLGDPVKEVKADKVRVPKPRGTSRASLSLHRTRSELGSATGLVQPVQGKPQSRLRERFEKGIRHARKRYDNGWCHKFHLSTDFDSHAQEVSELKLARTRGRVSVNAARDCRVQDAIWVASPGPYINCGRVHQGSVARFRLKVVNRSNRTYKTLLVKLVDLPGFSLQYRPQAIAMGMTRTIVLTCDCETSGEFYGQVELSTSQQGENRFKVPVYVKVTDPAVAFSVSAQGSATDLLIVGRENSELMRRSLVNLSLHADPLDTDSDDDDRSSDIRPHIHQLAATLSRNPSREHVGSHCHEGIQGGEFEGADLRRLSASASLDDDDGSVQ